jgi:hypothetical protein
MGKPIRFTGTETAICVGLGVAVGLSSARLNPGGGIAGLLGSMVGGFLFVVLAFLAVKVVWRLGTYLMGRIRPPQVK